MNHSDGDEAMDKIVVAPIITPQTGNIKGIVLKPKLRSQHPMALT
jgi:hypothetical protein